MVPRIVLYGASGHTGRFIAAEIARRGWTPVLAGRDLNKIAPVAAKLGAEASEADVQDTAALDRLLAGADALINAAGPFGATSPHLIKAALSARIPYFDVTAEPFVAKDLFETYAEPAREAGIVVAPAFAFFGALGDLLATAAKREWTHIDRIDLAFALDRWRPTTGTRLAGARRAGRRLILADGRIQMREPGEVPPRSQWTFESPFGEQPTVGEFSTVDIITIARHLHVDAIGTWINETPLADLSSSDPSGPEATDDTGRSAQTFVIEAVVRKGAETRRASLSGRDIYAVTAPIVSEAIAWLLDGRNKAIGAITAGELVDARVFLEALDPQHLSVNLN